jgi:hypothetical protein
VDESAPVRQSLFFHPAPRQHRRGIFSTVWSFLAFSHAAPFRPEGLQE